MAPYGQFCPVAAEVRGERWTPLVIRGLVDGEYRHATVHFRFAPAPRAKRCRWLGLAAVYMGDMPLSAARTIRIDGPQHLVRGFSRWFGLSSLIGLERPA